MNHTPLRLDDDSAVREGDFSRGESSLTGVLVYDSVNDRVTHAASRVGRIGGYECGELKGMTGTELFGAEGRDILARIQHRMVVAGPEMLWGQSLTLRAKDGSAEECFCTLRLSPSADGESYRQILSLEPGDADPGRYIADTAAQSRFVMEAAQCNLYEYDWQRKVMYYSESFHDIFGVRGLPGGPGLPVADWIAMIHPQDAETLPLHWRRLFNEGERYAITYRVCDVANRWHWMMATIHAIVNDERGQPRRVIGSHVDITAAMEVKKYSADTEERFRSVFNNVEVGIAVCDPDGVVMQVNPALALMLGRNREHFVGHLLSDFAHDDEKAGMAESLRRMLESGRRESLKDIRFSHTDGRTVWVNYKTTVSQGDATDSRHVVCLLDDVSHTREERERLWFEATHDVLTGCWNRRALLERLEQQVGIARRHMMSMAFCICDLDHFKQVNDMHGHQTGDKVLCRFVEILRESLRATEVVGRYGGEEFGIVFPGTSVTGATVSLERALDLFRKERFIGENGDAFRVTATFGVAGVTENADVREVIAWADDALYQGKSQGRNRVVAARPEGDDCWL